ncbi:hypothetical protein ABIE38_003510 [Dietzia sp. 2505]
MGTSRSRKRVEVAINRNSQPGSKMNPVAGRTPAGWVLVVKRRKARTIEMKPRQVNRYIIACAGGSWGNQGQVPPAPELTRPTVDLDTS